MNMLLQGTSDRAFFNEDEIPLGASDAAQICATATVADALGNFSTGAVAQKNPEVQPAFPVLRSPVRTATELQYFIGPCDSRINRRHEDMQRQRLGLENVPTTCTEGWQNQSWVNQLVVDFRDAIESTRPAGNDMVLVIALHQDDEGVALAVEEALAQVAPDERLRSSPRLAGAFVLDSDIRGLEDPSLSPVTLWCPATLPLDQLPDASSRTCAILPDNPAFDLGPFSFGTLPILPSREQYIDFINDFSVNQAGEMQDLAFRTPEFAATADFVSFGEFGAVTFLNNESITADFDDAFSYCVDDGPAQLFAFRSPTLESGYYAYSYEDCIYYGLPPDVCAALDSGVSTLDFLPEWHILARESSYDLGVFWEFPFLMRMDYRFPAAGAVSAFGFSVPFGVNQTDQSYFGTELWTDDEFILEDLLTQCTRFCEHPTFDSAGVYHVTDPFRTTYQNNCYLPLYPVPGLDGGFPIDP